MLRQLRITWAGRHRAAIPAHVEVEAILNYMRPHVSDHTPREGLGTLSWSGLVYNVPVEFHF